MTTPLQSSDLAVVEEAYRAFARGDIAAVVGVLDPQVAWTEAAGSAYAGTHVGPDAVVANVFAPLGADWESFVPVPSEFLPRAAPSSSWARSRVSTARPAGR